MRVEVHDSLEAVESLARDWDSLALANNAPFSAPAWQLAWWRFAAPKDAQLRVLAAHVQDELVAVAPLYAVPGGLGATWYAPLAMPACDRAQPLAIPGTEAEAASALVGALATLEPRPGALFLRGLPLDSPWPRLLAGAWPPHGARIHVEPVVTAPFVSLSGKDYEAWVKTLSSKFRRQLRRDRERLLEQGAVFRMASEPELSNDLHAFVQLHRARWEARGGSAVLGRGIEDMVTEAGRAFAGERRLLVACIDVGGRTVSAQVLLAAGTEVSHWLGGFDAGFGRLGLTPQALAYALHDAAESGALRFDLGAGEQPYKRQMADAEQPLATFVLFPKGPGGARARASVATRHLRQGVSRRIRPDRRERLKRFLRARRGEGNA